MLWRNEGNIKWVVAHTIQKNIYRLFVVVFFFSRIIACMKNIARNLSEIWTMFIFFYIFVWICMIFFFSVIKQFISSLQPCHLLYSFPVCIGNCLQNVISVETCRHEAERIIIPFLKWSTGCLTFFAFYLDSCILYFEWMWI